MPDCTRHVLSITWCLQRSQYTNVTFESDAILARLLLRPILQKFPTFLNNLPNLTQLYQGRHVLSPRELDHILAVLIHRVRAYV